jgi:rubrerythrin
METEQDKTLKALQTAIQMEVEGKEYYLKASQESTNQAGKKLLQSLAGEEDAHRQKFEQIYRAIQAQKAWPVTDFQPDGGQRLRTILANAAGKSGVKASDSELDAVQTAMAMENKTYDYYKKQRESATYDAERDFYNTVASEEREHYLILLDYYEYLKDPAGWFVTKEHPSLDAG